MSFIRRKFIVTQPPAERTPAEEFLIEQLVGFLKSNEAVTSAHQILNIGAGQSISVEQQLARAGCVFVDDRIDIENCQVNFPFVGKCWRCSVEEMRPVPSGQYCAVFANYVLEHIKNLPAASQEIFRVLAPGGLFLVTVPNTMAPEFILAKHSPLWFHKLIRQGQAWEIQYAYNGIGELLEILRRAGFQVQEEKYWSFVDQYLWKYPIVGGLGNLYDRLISRLKYRRFMGNVCLVLKKPV